jgi:hypothetical protein
MGPQTIFTISSFAFGGQKLGSISATHIFAALDYDSAETSATTARLTSGLGNLV